MIDLTHISCCSAKRPDEWRASSEKDLDVKGVGICLLPALRAEPRRPRAVPGRRRRDPALFQESAQSAHPHALRARHGRGGRAVRAHHPALRQAGVRTSPPPRSTASASPVHERVVWERPFCRLLHFEKTLDRRGAPAAEAPDRGADVRPLRDAAARHGRDHAARSTTSTSPTGSTPAWCRSSRARFDLDDYIDYVISMLHVLGAGRACDGGLPAVGAGAGGGRADGGARRPLPAGDDDADGRTDRHARQPDRGQHARQRPRPRLVPRQRHHARCRSRIRASCATSIPGFLQISGFMSA